MPISTRLPLLALGLLACGGGSQADRNPPRVHFTTPLNGDHVHETINIGVRADDKYGTLARIDVFANDKLVATSATDPLSIKWDSRTLPVGGPAVLKAVATDHAGNRSEITSSIVIDRGNLPSEKEAIYSIINEGKLDDANKLLDDVWDLGTRSQPVHIAPLTWQESPFDKYWRFIFYGLNPLADLTWAYYAMGDTRYRDKLLAILTSYVEYDEQRPEIPDWSFDDKHTTAFRALALVNAYGKLGRSHDLSPELAQRLRRAALKIGGFLANPNNFDDNYNHGFTEAAALLLIAANFPDCDSAASWQATALARLDVLMVRAVDGDSVEVEKSPFYHFYVMNFANEIAVWGARFGVPVSTTFASKAAAMTRYSTYVAHPNGDVPLIGASVTLNARKQSRTINQILGQSDPVFEYMRTGGRSGVEPTQRNVLFPESGHSVLRSAFGAAGSEFDQQTHTVFNVGPYRTSHSHLDGLSLVYASAGKALLVDSGLFAYEDGPGVEFFRSTPAHNTVVVDGADQAPGSEVAGATLTGDTWVYQSGSNNLYDGVVHRRGVLLVRRDLALVFDQLDSAVAHEYAQTWHFRPEASVVADATAATASDETNNPEIIVAQALSEGLRVETVRGGTAPKQGWYSAVYGQQTENTVATFYATGTSATFITLIASGSLVRTIPTARLATGSSAFELSVCRREAGVALDVIVSGLANAGETVGVTPSGSCP